MTAGLFTSALITANILRRSSYRMYHTLPTITMFDSDSSNVTVEWIVRSRVQQ